MIERLKALSRLLPALLAGLLILGVAGAAGVSKLEERDSFCINCHLAPEATYYERAGLARTTAAPFDLSDLAGFHYWQAADFRCIDCHRGNDSLVHRTRVLFLAAGDGMRYLSGRFDETVEKGNLANVDPNQEVWQGPERFSQAPHILNAGCLACHGETVTLVGFNNHFHNKLPVAVQLYQQTGILSYPPDWPGGIDPADLFQPVETLLTCLDCHRAHVTGFQIEFFLDQRAVVLPACVQCHREAGHGPLDL